MTLPAADQETLLAVARDAIAHGLAHAEAPRVPAADYAAGLQAIACSFVTLHRDNALRGCIGSLRAQRPLVCDVALHAYAAAFSDARFDPLRHEELESLHIHISILSALEPVAADTDAGLLAALRPGTDGLLIESEMQRATFLPTVWSSIPEPGDFLAALKKKAGMAPDLQGYGAWRYTTEDLEER